MNIYFVWYTQGADFTLRSSLFGVVKLTKNDKFDNINIPDMVLDLMHVEVFRNLMVVSLVKTE